MTISDNTDTALCSTDLDEVLIGEIVPDLGELAREANREHAAGVAAERDALGHYLNAGAALIEAKAQVRHGEWLPWLAENCPDIAERTVQEYMLVAKYAQSNPRAVADLRTYNAVRVAAATERRPPSDLPGETAWPPADPEGFADRLAEIEAGPQMPAARPPWNTEEERVTFQCAHACGIAVMGATMGAEDFVSSVTGEACGDFSGGLGAGDSGITVNGLRLQPSLISDAEDVLALLGPAIALLKSRIEDRGGPAVSACPPGCTCGRHRPLSGVQP